MGETMIVEFGWFLDRAPWAYSRPGLNRVRVGRKNLTGLLQTRLGLTRPDTSNAERVSQYLRRLQRLDTPDAWLHRSLQADPWSTAQELLAARESGFLQVARGLQSRVALERGAQLVEDPAADADAAVGNLALAGAHGMSG